MSEDISPIVRIENTKDFKIVIVSNDRRAASLLFPRDHEKLGRFEDIETISQLSSLFQIYTSNKNKKLIVFVESNLSETLRELKAMIYGAHAEKRGLLFAFSFSTLDEENFVRLISAGFDDAIELGKKDKRQFLRLYSWIRRFGNSSIPNEAMERDVVARLGNKRDRRIGKWTIVGSDMSAHDDSGRTVSLTRQEIDFLTLALDAPKATQDELYDKLFKAPHAIVHKLKKKLGSELPIQHDSNGRYRLLEQKPE
jgi:hypothetical protein